MPEPDAAMRDSVLTVDAIPGNANSMYPHIRLKGRWLERLGWKIGSEVHVRAKQDSIIIMRCSIGDEIWSARGDDSGIKWSECVLRIAKRMLSANHSNRKREIRELAFNLLALLGESVPQTPAANDAWNGIKTDLRIALKSLRETRCQTSMPAIQEVHDGPARCACLDVLEAFLSRISK